MGKDIFFVDVLLLFMAGINAQSVHTPNSYNYQTVCSASSSGYSAFKVRACNDAHLALMTSNSNGQLYELVIGGWGNGKSCLRRSKQGGCYSQSSGNFVSCSSYRDFWVGWSGDRIRVGRGLTYGSNTFLDYQDSNPYTVNYLAVSTGWGSTGDWTFNIVNGGWSNWGSWGSCSKSCASGTKSRSRSCSNPSPQNGGSSCSGSTSQSTSCNTHSCPVHGGWSSWSGWGSCSKTCGSGTRSRSRSCTNPSPANGGNQCSGSSSSSQSCNTQSCAVHGGWSSWGSWGSCSKSCGSGTQSKSRSCNNPTPANGGNYCSGSSSTSQSCNTHNCPIDGGWSSWGSWATCSLTCGGGSQSKTRTCTHPSPQYGGANCPNSASATQSCNTHNCPIDGGWSSWGSWATCSLTCGGGSQSKTRTCTNPSPQYGGANCPNSATATQSGNTHNCPIDGGWSSWGSWATCSLTCGGGSQSKTRTCTNPSPQYGGANCPNSASATQSCNTHNCPIDGGWSSWGSWATCSLTCGGGSQSKTRTCTNPSPQYGGANCPNSASATQSCNTHNCPIDGEWASWSSWGTCSLTCGGGIHSRSRSCSNPTPQYGGAYCTGYSSSTQSCNTHYCPIDGNWASWTSWNTCSVTCGGGSQSRSRTCTNPIPQYNGTNCVGSANAQQSCNTHHCPIDGGMTSWTAWGTCTVTCGGGTQDRTRSCTNPSPQYGGAACSGATSQTQDCNTQVCIIDPRSGAWSDWLSWGTCSVTCGGGRQSRSRTCTNPVPANGGLSCSGSSSSLQDCNSQNCPTAAPGQYIQLCPAGWFTCQAGGITCIDDLFKCDCASDCDDGSDEEETYASCPSHLKALCSHAGNFGHSPVITLVSLAFCLFLLGYTP